MTAGSPLGRQSGTRARRTTGRPEGQTVTEPRITLFARPGCHLCDEAREVISRVADDLGVTWEERDITRSEADLREYWEKIPVTFVDGVQHDFWRVSEERLRRALSSSGKKLAAGMDFVHSFTNGVW